MVFPADKMKFYLSFENAFHCNDYISEKFWRNALHSNLIPIVYGPHIDDVRAVAPPNSFIHAELFESPAALVEYIDYLDSNDTAYFEYHEWRTLYPEDHAPQLDWMSFGDGFKEERVFCELCRLIRNKRKAGVHQHYQSVMKFWHYDTYPECKEEKKFQDYQTKIENNLIINTPS